MKLVTDALVPENTIHEFTLADKKGNWYSAHFLRRGKDWILCDGENATLNLITDPEFKRKVDRGDFPLLSA